MSKLQKRIFVKSVAARCEKTLAKIAGYCVSGKDREQHKIVVSHIPAEIEIRQEICHYEDVEFSTTRTGSTRQTIMFDDNYRRILDSGTVAAYLRTAAELGYHKTSEICCRLFLSFAKTVIPLIERKYLNSHTRKPDYTKSHPENFDSIATKAYLAWIGEDPSEHLFNIDELFETGKENRYKKIDRKDEHGEIFRTDIYTYRVMELRFIEGEEIIRYEFLWNQDDNVEWYSGKLVDADYGELRGKVQNVRPLEDRFSAAMACGSAFHSFAQYEFHQAHSDEYVLENGETLRYAKKTNDRPDNGFGGLHSMVESGFFRYGKNSKIMETIAKAILDSPSTKHAAIEAEWVAVNGEELPNGWDSNKFKNAINRIRLAAKTFMENVDYLGATDFFSITKPRGKVLKIDLGDGRRNYARMTRDEILELPEVHEAGTPENLWTIAIVDENWTSEDRTPAIKEIRKYPGFGPHGLTPVSAIGGNIPENEIPDIWAIEPTGEILHGEEVPNVFSS